MGAGILAIAAQAAAAVQAPPPRAEFLPPRAVDHVVVMEEQRGDCSNCPLHRRTVTRSGSWVKDERAYRDGIETTYSDFASGTSFTLHRNREGALERLVVERNFEPQGQYEVRRRATGRRDTGLGEPCEIWALTTTLFQSGMESCESVDGIMLWSRSLGRISPRAVSVERRPIRPEEVRPPADLFALVQWPRLGRGAPASPGGYEVVLTSRSRGDERTTVLRSQGNLRSARREERLGDGVFFSAGDGTSGYFYRVDESGRATKLEVGLPEWAWGGAPRWEAVRGRAPRRLLGERCTWQDETSVQSTDTVYECRTADGVPLMLEYDWHWDSVTDIYRARRVTRRRLTEADLAPPPEARDWASWGVTQPAR